MVTVDDLLKEEVEKIHAINFLKKVFNNNNNLTLLEIQKSLNLEFIKNHIQNINYNDVIDLNKDSVDKVFIEKDIIYELILDIIPKNKVGINTKDIVEYIKNNTKIDTSGNKFYNKIAFRLLILEKKDILKTYKDRNKKFWIKN